MLCTRFISKVVTDSLGEAFLFLLLFSFSIRLIQLIDLCATIFTSKSPLFSLVSGMPQV